MKKFYVYIHTCPNGKKYVGCTTQAKPEFRWGKNGERYQHQLFGKAILKYGWDNITHEVFEVGSKEEMYRKEVELISFYHSNDPEYGYNNSVGGEKGALGYRHPEETRKKISKAAKERAKDPEYKKKLSEALKGRTFSEETLGRMSKAKKGKLCSEEVRKRIAENNRRRAKDPEFRKKLSESHKGKPHSEETREKIAKSLKGKPKPQVKIKLPDGTIVEISKPNLTKYYINRGKKFEYIS